MKKLALLALTLILGAAFTTASADKKKEKKKKRAQVTVVDTPIAVQTARDSLSYAAGYSAAEGLTEYLQRQHTVDLQYLDEAIAAFKATLGKTTDPVFVAQQAGIDVAKIFVERILPSMQDTFAGTPDSIDTRIFTQAFIAAVQGDTTVFNREDAAELTRTKAKAVKEEKDTAWRIHNTQWLVNNGQQPGIVTTQSGLQYKVITEGKGDKPTEQDRVTVKYEGRLVDGTVFDSSYKRDPQTTTFRVNQVIKGWTEALTLMTVGSKWELYIPQELGYGARQQGKDIKPYSTLIFTVELVDIAKD